MDPEGAANEVGDERVRRRLFIGHAPRRHAIHPGRQSRAELRDQPRLADTRLTDDVDDLASPLLGFTQGGIEPGELQLAPDERRRIRLDRHVEDADHPIGDHRLAFSLQRDRLALLELEAVHRQSSRRLADQHLAERCGRLEPLRGVHRIADDRVRPLHVAGEQTRHDLAGVHADAKRQTHPVFAIEVVIEPDDRRLHRKRREDRALGVVLVRDRRTEHRHHRVADVFVDRALVPLDLPRERTEVRAEDPAQLLGVELLRQRCRAG